MKKISLLTVLVLILIVSSTYAQNVQWAFKVLEYSSQKSNKDYAAVQVLGKHNVLPSNGENVKSWQPKTIEKESFIKVGFLTPIIPKQIVIAESFNPGYITNVYVYNADGKEFEIPFQQNKTTSQGRFLHINTASINFYVLAV